MSFSVDRSGKTALHKLVETDLNIQLVRELLSKSPDIAHVIDKSGETALHVAARCGSILCAKELVLTGVDLDIQSKGKLDTALILAACHGHVDCITLLLSSSADITLQTRQGINAERWARKRKHFQIEEILKQQQLNINQTESTINLST